MVITNNNDEINKEVEYLIRYYRESPNLLAKLAIPLEIGRFANSYTIVCVQKDYLWMITGLMRYKYLPIRNSNTQINGKNVMEVGTPRAIFNFLGKQ